MKKRFTNHVTKLLKYILSTHNHWCKRDWMHTKKDNFFIKKKKIISNDSFRKKKLFDYSALSIEFVI